MEHYARDRRLVWNGEACASCTELNVAVIAIVVAVPGARHEAERGFFQ
jgi:hypothetical protein